jgi:radical SAM protein with 4Fe4S-binding SPASM domain
LNSKGFESKIITTALKSFLIKMERKGFMEEAVLRENASEVSLQLYLTNKCNLQCIHCYVDAGKYHEDTLTSDEFGSIIDEFANIFQTKVIFTGGEALLYQDFFTLANRAKKNNLKVFLFTNGTLITSQMIDKLEECVDEIQFSLDGATASVNDLIRGEGVYNKVLHSIHLLKNTKIKQRLAIVLMPQNIEDFRENVEELAKFLEHVEMKFGFVTTEGRADESLKFPSSAEADKKLQEILSILYKKKLKAMNKFEPNWIIRNCGYGETITVSSNGDIFPCAILKHKYGNIRTNNFLSIVEKIKEDMIASNVENLELCPQCDLQYLCFGGCRLNHITHNGSLLKTHCPPEKKKDFYRKLIIRDEFDALSVWLGQVKN